MHGGSAVIKTTRSSRECKDLQGKRTCLYDIDRASEHKRLRHHWSVQTCAIASGDVASALEMGGWLTREASQLSQGHSQPAEADGSSPQVSASCALYWAAVSTTGTHKSASYCCSGFSLLPPPPPHTLLQKQTPVDSLVI